MVREPSFGFVREACPEVLDRYGRAYPGADAPADHRAVLERPVARVRAEHGFLDDRPPARSARSPGSRGGVPGGAPRQPARTR